MKEGQILPKNRSSPARLSEFPDVSSTNRDRLNKTSADGEGAALGILPSARANSRMAPNALDETRVSEEIQREPLLHTRSFKVDPNTLVQGLQETAGSNPGGTNRFGGDSARLLGKTHDAEAVAASLRQFFKAAGVDLSPPKSLFFNHRLGLLMVRANLQDLDTIEQAIQMLNTSPPQLTIEVKFCEVTQDDNRALGFDWLLDNTGLRNSAPALLTYTGILTDPQFRVVIRALEQRQGVDLLSARKITTLSGRQAQIKTVDVKYIVTNLAVLASNRAQSATGGVSTIVQPMMEPVELGPVLDVVPHVSADGYTIQMTVIGTIKEFLGYDLEGHQPAWAADSPHAPPYPNNTPKETTTPRPTFRVRQVVTTAVVYDGQTLVLEGGSFKESELHKDSVPVLGDLPLVGRLFRNESSVSKRKKLLIFVTPTLIDPAGNRLHSEEEMALRKKGVPPQPAAGEKAQ